MSCKHIALLPILVLLLAACASATQPALAPPGETQVLRLATTTSTEDSGLLDAILPDFEARCGCRVDVVAVGTGQALEIGAKGDADVVLVHSRKAEDEFVTEGHARERFDVMVNDFIIVGPRDDPAQIADLAAAKDAFESIMNSQALFASRGDKSGTHSKELSIWSSLNVTPTAEMPWYKSLGQGMGETLIFANEQSAYALADRGTFLSASDRLPNLVVLVGGANLSENKDEALLNPYGVMAINPDLHPGVRFDLAMQFIDWLTSPETQAKIGSYGADEYGQPLFYPTAGR